MKLRVADLIVEVPAAGGMTPRCKDYLTDENLEADIVISADRYNPAKYGNCDYDLAAYLDSGFEFYGNLLRFGGLMLHASAVAYEGRAYLFSGPCGMGKSTHTRLWQQIFGESAVVINDDKPALRRIDGKWYAYGTPWCGKDGINVNAKVPLGGICFLKRGERNEIYRLDSLKASASIISQTLRKFKKESNLTLMLSHVDKLVREIPIFEFKNLPLPESARLSYETMSDAAKEVGL